MHATWQHRATAESHAVSAPLGTPARGGRTFGLSGLPADKEASLPEEEEGNR